jgi:hypothetical protein
MTRPLILLLALLLPALLPPAALAQTPPAAAIATQHYTLDARFDPGAATLTGEMTVVWTNTTGEPQATLPLRLYPNAEHYAGGAIEIEGARVEGDSAVAELDQDDPTVARVPLGSQVPPGDTRTLALSFTTTVPTEGNGGFGIFRRGPDTGIWALVNWYPIVAGWEPGAGWSLDPPVAGVDPTFVTASAWDVTIAHPAALALVATGDEGTIVDGASAVTRIELPIGRELAVVALPADEVAATTGSAGGAPVAVTLPRAWAVPGIEAALLEFAGQAVPRLGDWLDAPLDHELDLTAAELDGALGLAWTGAIWLDVGQIAEDGRLDDAEREGLRFYVYHEIAHQWFSNRVGADTNDHTWMAEGLAGVLAVAVIRDEDGAEAGVRAFMGGVAGPYRAFVNGGQDAIADSPIGELPGVVHSFVSYGKGGVGFEAIRQEIGDEAFFAALSALCREYAWGILSPGEMLAAFETASQEDLGSLWSFWFEQSGVTVAQVDAVIAGAGA